jgi:hypothetical protein
VAVQRPLNDFSLYLNYLASFNLYHTLKRTL